METLTLQQDVCADIHEFLQHGLQELLFNERDFQMHLASYLRNTGTYEDVDMEYYVPYTELDHFVWESELWLDILVMRQGEYLPVELKYKTKKVERALLRFNEQLSDKVVVMKNQGAQDLGMYDFWKDVRRVELVRQRFEAVKNGLAVFLTNDKSYMRQCNPTSNSYHFAMTEGPTVREKHWLHPELPTAKPRPGFDVEQSYAIHWNTRTLDQVDFHYCIVEI